LIMVDATMVSRRTLTSSRCRRASALAGDEVPQKANADACRSLEQVAILHPKFSCPPTECKHRQIHCGCDLRTERNQRSQDPGRIRVLPPRLGRRNSAAGPPTTRNPRRSIRDLQSCFTCSAAKDPERPQKAPRANHQQAMGATQLKTHRRRDNEIAERATVKALADDPNTRVGVHARARTRTQQPAAS
jgi:hypothetical protein